MTHSATTDITATRRFLRHRAWSALTAAVFVFAACTAHAAFTTEKCIAGKLKAWGRLRQCQRTEESKAVQARKFDGVKCQTKFQDQAAKIAVKATKAAIGCRYLDNGDSTITDTDTGLMWEKKTDGNVGTRVDWITAMTDFLAGYNGTSADGQTLGPGSIYRDWRLPNMLELATIVDVSAAGCPGSVCIDPLFGPTAADDYFSSTTYATHPDSAYVVDFGVDAFPFVQFKTSAFYVRAVRGGL